MYLRDLQMNISPLADMSMIMSRDEWRQTLHTVVERYLDELPRRKVQLGGAAKIVVVLGQRETTGPLSHGDFGLADGLGRIWLPQFDFAGLRAADFPKRQVLFLEALHEGLLRIASRINADQRPFVGARESLLHRIPLPEITEKELLTRWGLIRTPRKPKAAVSKRSPAG
jgi:hypothetical protein